MPSKSADAGMTTRLKRGLGLSHVFCIATGAMISSGIFVLPGLAYERAGPAVVFSYFMAGLLAATGLLSVAELATAMPKAGGDYFFITRSMGSAVGTVAGLLTWFSLSLKSAFALVGMAAFAKLLVHVEPHVAGLLLCAGFVALNLVGVKEAARFQVAVVMGLLALMCIYIVLGLPEVNVRHFEPFVDRERGGVPAVFATVGFVFVSYGGLLKVASVAEEVRRPGRTIPLGMILSLFTALVAYTLMVFVTCGVLERDKLSGSLIPISEGARAFMGGPGFAALSVAAILAFLSTANAGIMAASRYLLALSRDRLLPEPVGRIGRRFRTPHAAILVTGGLVAAALFLKLPVLVEAASTVLILSYILSNISVIVLRESGVQNYRPLFRAPLYPWVQVVGIIGLAYILLEMGEAAFFISAVLIAIGFGTYWFYGRAQARRESALLHLVERITDRVLVTGSLEAELKDIIRERDEIVADRFDRVIERGVVLDVEESMDLESFFRLAAEKLSDRVGMSPSRLAALLLVREQESRTVIAPGLAVPHVVVDGEKLFEILLARSRGGITFSQDAPKVHAVFVLVGTRDERNFHLRALAAIAQIAQDPQFESRWMAARNEQALRDLVLLGQRRRGE